MKSIQQTLFQRFNALLNFCRNDPDRPALCFNGKMLSFGQFGERVQAIYDAMDGAPEGPVLIHGHKELDIVPAMTAATFAGRGFVFAEVVYPQSRIDQIINLCGVKLVVKTHDKAFPQRVTTIATRELSNTPLRDLRLNPDDEDTLFYFTFTSGSTGTPKGIPTRRSCFAALQNWFEPQNTHSKGGAGAHVNHASMAFDMSMSDIWTALFAGRGLFLIDHADTLKPRRILNALVTQPNMTVGTFTATPAFYSLMMEDPKFNAKTLPDLKSFWIGGDAVQQSVLRDILIRFPLAEIYCAYGPSEATCVTHSRRLTFDDIQTEGPLDLGVAQLGSAAMIATSEGLKPTGEGEVVLIGDQVAKTYLPLEHPNNASFVTISGKRAFYTGDVGQIDAAGRLKIFGRSDSQVKVNGFRIELAEIERTAQQVAGIKFAIVQLVGTGAFKELVLTITPDRSHENLCEAVRTHLRECLPPYMVPATIRSQASMPLTVAGKIDRAKVLENI